MPESANGRRHVVVVGGGFAGIACAQRLAKQDDVHVTLLDRHNYHQFQPLLYQVATCQLAPADVASSLRKIFHKRPNVDVKLEDVTGLDPAALERHDRRRAGVRRRRRRAGGRVAAELLPHARCGGARAAALLAGRRDAPALPGPRRLRGRRPQPRPARGRRAELRRRGRRRHRRRGRGRAGGHDPRHAALGVPRPPGDGGAGARRRPRPHAARPVLRPGARLRRQGARPQGRPPAHGRRGERGRAGARHARRRHGRSAATA